MPMRKLISGFHKMACCLCLMWAIFQVMIVPFFFDSITSAWTKIIVCTIVTVALWILFPRYVMRRRMVTVSTRFYRALQFFLAFFFLIVLTLPLMVFKWHFLGSTTEAVSIYLSICAFLTVLITYRTYGSCMYRFMSGRENRQNV